MDKSLSKTPSVTVADVARRAGVSKATAARVLGGYGTVSDRVREAVTAAASSLDYRPNELARSMTTGRSGTIGVVVGDIENPFFSLAVRGITDIARQAGFTVILINSGEDIFVEKAAIRTLLARRVDGLIVSPANENDVEHLHEAIRSGLPLALLDRGSDTLDVDTVLADDRHAAENVTSRLIALGHRRIAYLTACDTPDHCFHTSKDISTGSVRRRIEGYLDVCRRAGLVGVEDWVKVGAVTPERTHRIVVEMLQSANPPTAIIASDSIIGLEVFKAHRDLGVNIPGDVSLISFHDADWTSVTSPPITVVRQPVYELGATAARLLVERLNGADQATRKVVLKTEVVERASTRPI
ncbi:MULTISPECIES: LacI family DNA-binding transcriptional regulator [Agrobacterium]|uniref:LacI family transcriptional regulator n=1 Tax=Agrobacterium tumefaciens TaxID=358 RepID=A0AAE6EI87_AGRTU|nr:MULTISPECIES: LacI family DNA-binding transcriptional regulator [Agrobacterium]QCL77204.1 LacI family transcriptional regulator [Agrobacterium tumefaciens]QCL82712.1 LacI family transcriptional regulator [Agrobacterium tumefaciens]CUX70491.1 Santhopine-responsive transcriptional repressor [Agrobacterium sp. NCPPB 925]